MGSFEPNDAHFHGTDDRLSPVSRVEFGVDRSQVVLDGLQADEQGLGDFGRREALSDQLEDLLFAFEILRMNLDAKAERKMVGFPGAPPPGPVL